MKVVVCGSTGFIGRRLVGQFPSLAVTGLSSSDIDLTAWGGAEALAGQLDDDTTLVVASCITPDKGRNMDAVSKNFAIAGSVARAVEGRRIRKCVYLSSDAVYPFTHEPTTEASATEPADAYSLAKWTTERVLTLAAEASDTPLLILRPTGVFGPGDTHNSYGPNRFVRQVAEKGEVSIFGEGEETRDHIYVDDVAAITAALSLAEATGTMNIATGESRSFASVLDTLSAVSATSFAVHKAPRSGAVTHRSFHITALRDALPGLSFTDFEEALKLTLESACES